ncbi:MAG: hypothetical protein R3284_00970 [Rubricoccaceae bacterium]|nr:hypothetical protein [Rubricoccaceae bacterium]
MFPILRPILNKGGAGYYISREETVRRLNPIVAKTHELQEAYNEVLPGLDDDLRTQVEAHMPKARMLLGKIAETVFSAGGTPPNGVDIEAAADTSLFDVLDLERGYRETVHEEIDAVHHQERTRAILKAVVQGSDDRLETLRAITNRLPQPARD